MRQAPEDSAVHNDPLHHAGADAGQRAQGEVTILLALHNGARFLADQLDSFEAQDHEVWRLLVSDDGSTDAGPAILHRWARAHPDRQIRRIGGPKRGFARNFLHLLSNADPQAPFVAFSDQDDVWLPGKISRALEALRDVPAGQPAIHCGGRLICDRDLAPAGRLRRARRAPSFRNALAQNVTPGNTIMLNRAAVRLLQAAARRVDEIPFHDWWAYQMVTGAGGRVILDPAPGVLYRQHGANVMGANRGARAWLHRLARVARGDARLSNSRNVEALRRAAPYLTPANRALVQDLAKARTRRGLPCIARLARIGLHRQTRIGTLALWLATALGLA